MSLKGKKVLVTGAGGFIGSHLAEKLVEIGAETRALVRYTSSGHWGWLDSSPRKKDLQVFVGDLRDQDSMIKAMEGVEIVFNLAALIAIPYSYQAPLSYVRTNIEGTVNVLRLAQQNQSKVIQTSTSEVYGTAQYVPIDEKHPLQGQSPYAATKIGADQIAESFYRSFGQEVAIVRPFNTYGPRQSARAIIPSIITQVLTQPKLKLGNLKPTRDLNFVADTVDGFIAAAASPKSVGQVINLGSGREISIGELATTIMARLGKKLEIETESVRLRPDKSEVERLLADRKKAETLLGWKPRYTLDQGIDETIAWMKGNLEQYRPDTYVV